MDNDAHLQFMNEIDNFASRFQQQKKSSWNSWKLGRIRQFHQAITKHTSIKDKASWILRFKLNPKNVQCLLAAEQLVYRRTRGVRAEVFSSFSWISHIPSSKCKQALPKTFWDKSQIPEFCSETTVLKINQSKQTTITYAAVIHSYGGREQNSLKISYVWLNQEK